MVDAYTAGGVGPVMVDGVEKTLSLADREAKADKWNAKAAAKAARIASEAAREDRLTALGALIANRTATPVDVLEYLSVRDGLEAT